MNDPTPQDRIERARLYSAWAKAEVKRTDAEGVANAARKALNQHYDEVRYRDRCTALVRGDWSSHRCSRNSGYGKDGSYCKQHAKRHPGEV